MFHQPPAVKVLSIPELLEFIHPYLSTSDIVHCSIVSKAFSEIFTPPLWHTISLRTEAQHRRFTENPEVHAALQRNGKYIRVIQVETCKSLAPFLNVDADLLKNVHTLQLPYSIGHDEEFPGITYSDTTQTTKRLETKSAVPWRISDWLQEKDVFLMYHEVALRMLRIHQTQSEHIRDKQLEKLTQAIDQAQQQLSASRKFLSGSISLLQQGADSIASTDSSPLVEKEALLKDAETFCRETNKSSLQLSLELVACQQYSRTTNLEILQLIRSLEDVVEALTLHIVRNQQSQDWRSSFPNDERLLVIKRLFESLKALSPTITDPKILELAKTFENITYLRSPNKEEYIKAYMRKLEQIRARLTTQLQQQASGASSIAGSPQVQVPMATTPMIVQQWQVPHQQQQYLSQPQQQSPFQQQQQLPHQVPIHQPMFGPQASPLQQQQTVSQVQLQQSQLQQPQLQPQQPQLQPQQPQLQLQQLLQLQQSQLLLQQFQLQSQQQIMLQQQAIQQHQIMQPLQAHSLRVQQDQHMQQLQTSCLERLLTVPTHRSSLRQSQLQASQAQVIQQVQQHATVRRQQLMAHHQSQVEIGYIPLRNELFFAEFRRKYPFDKTSRSSTWNCDQDMDLELLQSFLLHIPGVTAFSGTGLLKSHSVMINALAEKLERSGLRFLSLVYREPLSLDCTNHTRYLGQLLDNCSLQLETLRVSGMTNITLPSAQGPNNSNGGNSSNSDMSTTHSNTSRPMRTRIRQLLLDGNVALHIRPLFLNQCPELQSLSLSIYSDETVKIAARCIGEYCPLLEELAIVFVKIEINSSYLVSLLESCSTVDPQAITHPTSTGSSLLDQETLPCENRTFNKRVGLKKLMLCGFRTVQSQSLMVDALCQYHSSTLTHLAIKSSCGVFSDHRALGTLGSTSIQKIVKSFKKLEHMDFTTSGNITIRMPHFGYINAQAFVGLDMAWPFATTLKALRIMIDGILRPTSSYTWLGGLSRSPTETQVKICQILGSLTALEELALGIDDDEPLSNTDPRWGYQHSCLKLTLETGLCSMDQLKRLRVFNVARMDHDIRQKELEWMCESWPELMEIHGLLRSQEVVPRVDHVALLNDMDTESEILNWVKEHYPHLRYT